MTVIMTKDDFRLLLDLYEEAFEMIIVKKYFNIDISPNYNIEKYMQLKEKLLRKAEEQKFDEKEIYPEDNNFVELIEKISKNKTEKEGLLELQIKELCTIDEFREQIFEMALKIGKEIKDNPSKNQ